MSKKPAFALAFLAALIGGIWGACRGAPMHRSLGAVAPIATAVQTNGNCPLGWWQKDPNSSTCSTAFGWTPAYADAATTVFAIQNLAPSDFDFVTAVVHAQVPGAVDFTGEAWWRIKWGLKYPVDAGAFADPTGAEAGTPVDSQVGSQLAGCAPTLVQAGGQLGVQMLCGIAVAVEGNIDWDRSSLAPWVLSVSPNTVRVDAGGTVVITTTPGGAQYAQSATFAGFNATCSQVTDRTASCVIPASAGYLADGGLASGGVSLVSAANPFSTSSGFFFNNGGPGFTLSGIYLQPAVPTGGTPNLVVTCAAGSSPCTSVTSATMCGTAATVAATSAASITLTPPANTATSGTTCAITATNSNGTFTLSGCTTGTSACGSGLGVLPANVVRAWYAAQGWNVGAQTWNDLVANEQMTKFGTAYTTTASWSGGQPGVTGADTVSALFSTTLTQAQPLTVFQANSIASGVAANPFEWGGGNAASVDGIAETTNLALYAGTTVVASPAPTYATPFWHEDNINAATSFTAINGGAHTVVGATVGTNTISAGFVVFNRAAANQGMIGTIGLTAVYNGTPTAGEETNMSNIALAIYGNGM